MPEKVLMSATDIRRALVRIAHEITERNRGVEDVVLVGMRTRGVPLAQRIAAMLQSSEGIVVPLGSLDISFYRDDLFSRELRPVVQRTEIPVDITDKHVILVDDVFYTGRSIRAALDALMDFGRPKSIQLAVLADRGHRELPIRADYAGKNIPTSHQEEIEVRLEEVDGQDTVVLIPVEEVRNGNSQGAENSTSF